MFSSFCKRRLEIAEVLVRMGLIEYFMYNDNGILWSCENERLCVGMELFLSDVYYYYYCYNLKR